MHKLAELCVKRPVFASVLILSLVVVGMFAYAQLGVDRFPNVDFPFVTISTRLVGAGARGDRDRDHRQDRRGGQHHQRNRSADLHLFGGHIGRHRPVRSRERRRRRGPGSARSRQHRPAGPSDRRRSAAHRENRPRRLAGAFHRALGARSDPGYHRVRRQDASASDRVGSRRGPGADRGRPAAADQRGGGQLPTRGAKAHRRRGGRGAPESERPASRW